MGIPGGWELVLIVLVIMVLFGAKRLPEASRSLGRSMRIFKAETKGLRDDDTQEATGSDVSTPPAPITPPSATPPSVPPPHLVPPVPVDDQSAQRQP
jgi:sec-independent protein translocase protein TatA